MSLGGCVLKEMVGCHQRLGRVERLIDSAPKVETRAQLIVVAAQLRSDLKLLLEAYQRLGESGRRR